MPKHNFFVPKPGPMIAWKDLLDKVQKINVLRYGSSYEIHLGANLALRDVERLIEEAEKFYPGKSLPERQGQDG